jgi:23S rRNA pseudouridine2605 synthase
MNDRRKPPRARNPERLDRPEPKRAARGRKSERPDRPEPERGAHLKRRRPTTPRTAAQHSATGNPAVRPSASGGAVSGIRLQVYLARCGLGSRRGCEELILAGRVQVNEARVERLGTRVAFSDRVTVDGRVVKPVASLVYLAVHKPAGYLCANEDPEGRPLASDLFKGAIKERLFHVGRLDYLSTGLIFYTNDGEFDRVVSHPGSLVEKQYLVETARAVDEAFLEQYRKGFWVEGVRYRCEDYELRSPHSVLITLVEGKNRELRNVFAARRIRVKRVHRIRIGVVTLRGLQPGRFRRLTEREVKWFYEHGGSA